MHEILIDRRQVVAVHHRVHELLAHRNERRGAARREIEPAEKFLPARLGGEMQFGRGLVRALARPGIDGGIDAARGRPRSGRQRLEERDARAGGQFVVERENLARERHAGGFAASGQQFLAQFDQAVRTCRSVTAPVARAVDQRAPALRIVCNSSPKNEVFIVLSAMRCDPDPPI